MPIDPLASVSFRFQLPGALLLRAPLGRWSRAPRGVTVDVAPSGEVAISCRNGSELHARAMVIASAASFLRAIDRNVPPTVTPAKLTATSCGDREIDYAISLGARVSIARTGEAPEVFGNPLLALVG